jgi:uncharacterized protein
MLIRFTVSNFLSFNEETEFNMLTGNFKIHKSHITRTNKIDLLKTAAIYGANGSGKSNLIKAVEMLKNLATETDDPLKLTKTRCFKLEEGCQQKPSSFEIEFITHNKIYTYGLSFLQKIITEEYLYKKTKEDNDELIFERKFSNGVKKIEMNSKFTSNEKDKYYVELFEEELLKDNQTFLSQAKGKRFKDINLVYEWFDDSLIIIFPQSKYLSMLHQIVDNLNFKEFVTSVIKNVDTGIQDLTSKEISYDSFFGEDEKSVKEDILKQLDEDKNATFIIQNELSEAVVTKSENGSPLVHKLITRHPTKEGELIDFEITEESDGSRRLLDIIPALDAMFKADITIFIDEINRSMHPSMTKELITLFLINESSKGQLIFTTHESNLLDLKLLRPDEIWFTEKKEDGSTTMYPLSDFKPRYDLDIRKGYLQGRFGAIPFLGNLKDLSW